MGWPPLVAEGDRFGRLTVVRPAPSAAGKRRYVCRCDCGAEKVVVGTNLRHGRTQSCGCLQRERVQTVVRDAITRHGMTDTPTWNSWAAMIQRCTNPKHLSFANYGGRGITVCEEWLDSFEAFLKDVGERPEGCSLDRIDSDGNYEPGNCRWATPLEQRHNWRPDARRRVRT